MTKVILWWGSFNSQTYSLWHITCGNVCIFKPFSKPPKKVCLIARRQQQQQQQQQVSPLIIIITFCLCNKVSWSLVLLMAQEGRKEGRRRWRRWRWRKRGWGSTRRRRRLTLRPKKMRATHLTTVANMFYGNTTAHDEERMLVMDKWLQQGHEGW